MHTLDGIITVPVSEVDQVLKHFYVDIRKHDGQKYTKKSMINNRFGLQKHFLRYRDIDIINDKQFQMSNDTFKAVLVNLKGEGKATTKHKEIISDEDLEKMYKSGHLSLDTPATLQNKVFFDYMLYFCNRGRENLRETMTSDFEIIVDGTGKKYVTLAFSRQTKNHRGDDLTDDDIKGGVMYEPQGDKLCPVRSFEKYLSLLNPSCKYFWQRPKPVEKVMDYSTVWYDNVAVGRNTLGHKMKSFSIECKLSKVYTNHCICATCISILDEAGISDRHICGISGHKSIESLNLSEGKRRDVSSLLCQKLVSNETPVLPNDFSVEPLSENDINADSAIEDFLSPSQEDKNLATISDADMINVPEKDIDIGNVRKGDKRCSTGDAHGEGLGKRSKIPAEHPAMNLVSHGTVNIHYHYY